MRAVDIFYQTKRGETVPTKYKLPYKNSDLSDIGKLCLAGIFQMPGTSRNKPSSLYSPQYYDIIFDGNQSQIVKICQELLYIDYYFRKVFQKRFDAENRTQPNAKDRMTFAHNARTICIAFVMFASRYHNGSIELKDLQTIFNASRKDTTDPCVYDLMKDLSEVDGIFPNVFPNKDKYDELLYKLFMLIIDSGITCYSMTARYEEALSAANYLKKDKHYYSILEFQWNVLQKGIDEIFSNI